MSKPFFFISSDPFRAVGLALFTSDFVLICEKHSYVVDWLSRRGIKALVLKSNYNNSGKILAEAKVGKFISDYSGGITPEILVFKPSAKIDLLARNKGYKLLANSAVLNKKFEDKTSFYKLCLDNNLEVPKGFVARFGEVDFERAKSKLGLPLVIQFGRGWAGGTTFFIANAKDYLSLQKKFHKTKVKFSQKVEGITVLNNACITSDDQVLVSQPAIQLSGALFGQSEAVTFGRQWGGNLIPDEQEARIATITKKVGHIMAQSGYKGWFVLDFILSTDGEVVLSENNARLTASFSFYTQLEVLNGSDVTLLASHIAAFAQRIAGSWHVPKVVGSQISLRTGSRGEKVVKKSLQAGIYGRDLKYRRDGVGLVDLTDQSEVFINFPDYGTLLPQNSQLVTIETRNQVLKNEHNVYPWLAKVAKYTESNILYE